MVVYERVFKCALSGTMCGIILVDGVEDCVEVK